MVAAVVALAVALGVSGGTHTRPAALQAGERRAAVARVDGALAALHADVAARVADAAAADAAGGAAVHDDARAALTQTLERARRTLDSSAGQVADEAPRAALAAQLGTAQGGSATASPVAVRGLVAAVAQAEEAVHAAVAEQQARVAAEQEAAARAAAARTRASSGGGAAGASAARDRCATTYSGPAFYTSPPTAGGDGSNGRLPASALSAVSWTRDSRGTPFYLRSDAAAALERLNAAFRAALGHDLALDLTYRDLETQVAMREALGTVAAVPGTSSHGTGLALDVPELPCEYGWDSAARAWLVANGPAYGWVSPSWARQNGSNPEYWHYEYRG
ncbi:peptidase M15B and M15C DD-carboxypeptidase VanY/endolysin [Cellulomonas flavigena DSM 20109]|uniref:Peptidase M15B and M15C DD-carboxypeptidase VanY/endolysin n=1 Tax=Cellulomonas flavigena (strain ATCC 482 / DSM 20109 / BCRC 11376 / JCM 18109 / NBRC 3775 / NCIMB 8073 / NRS 134) TaxID=446466 RepID=D5UIJ6_CELFN|nr:M15 family metallopeptidase [Cellulomonas flavigena]ADG73495.1 peptidase M15B and M15C DD-carboxypeptidase VanY/endolysin [Cellulomonas flavigena DSM 20109]